MRKISGEVVTDLASIDAAISCAKETPLLQVSDRVEVRNTLKNWQKDRQAELMKELGLPLDAPQPLNVCWMEMQ